MKKSLFTILFLLISITSFSFTQPRKNIKKLNESVTSIIMGHYISNIPTSYIEIEDRFNYSLIARLIYENTEEPWIEYNGSISYVSAIEGDINNNQQKNLIVVTHVEGEEGGGNSYRRSIFIFETIDNKYFLMKVIENAREIDSKILGFDILGISDNVVKVSYLADDNDAGCCPSLEYEAKIKLDKDFNLTIFDEKLVNINKQILTE